MGLYISGFCERQHPLYPDSFLLIQRRGFGQKNPLLRSMEALSKQALRILRLLGNTTVKKVITTVGAEQEYFLIDKKLHDQRKDLIYTGRTLFGAMPPKGQEMDDHYYGAFKERISAFMKELDRELWNLAFQQKQNTMRSHPHSTSLLQFSTRPTLPPTTTS